MYIVFFSTSDVFLGEDELKKKSIQCKVVPTPVTDKAYCGVCLEVAEDIDLSLLEGIEYRVITEV